MDISGKIKMIDATKEVGSQGFKKRDFVITTDSEYPQHIIMQMVKDKCDVLDGYKVGDSVKVDININGRIWVNPQGEDVYFNTITAWRIAKEDTSRQTPPPANTAQTNTNPISAAGNEDEPDDLPF